jgi:hypothetical protein
MLGDVVSVYFNSASIHIFFGCRVSKTPTRHWRRPSHTNLSQGRDMSVVEEDSFSSAPLPAANKGIASLHAISQDSAEAS